MTKQYIVYLVMTALLSACGSGGSGGGSPAAPAGGNQGGTIGGQSAANFYKQFEMNTTADCAGFRRSFTYLIGGATIDGMGFDMNLRIAGDGTYLGALKEDSQPYKELRGTWKLEGNNIVFDDLGVGTGELFMNRIPRLALKFTKDRLGRSITGKTIYLTADETKNDSRMAACSPKDHPRMQNSPSGILIDGADPDLYWAKALRLGEVRPDGSSIPIAGSYLTNEGEAGVRVLMKADGTFRLTQAGIGITRVDIIGAWYYQEGLVVLKDLGVMVPASRNGTMWPILYFSHDPVTRVREKWGFTAVALPGTGG